MITTYSSEIFEDSFSFHSDFQKFVEDSKKFFKVSMST